MTIHRRSTMAFCLAVVAALAPGVALPQAPDGWIQSSQWLFLGPLGNPYGCAPGDLDDLWIAPHRIQDLSPAEGEPLEIDFAAAASQSWLGAGDSPSWVCLGSLGLPADDLVDLEAAALALSGPQGPPVPTTYVAAVLVSYVTLRSPEPLAVNLCTSSDDSIQVWVNDQKVQEVRTCRSTAAGCSEKAGALLVPGQNAIKVALWQGIGAWSFRLRIERLDGGVITSAGPEALFGCRGGGPAPLSGLGVERRILTDLPDCASPGGAAAVELRGTAGSGPDLTIAEKLTFFSSGPIAVESITSGGTFIPAGAPAGGPVGIFNGAADIGGPCGPGSTVDNLDGSTTVTGGGYDIWTDGDQFQFAYQVVKGDFDMTVHVARREWASGTRWGKAGIMARQSFSSASRYSMIQTHGENQTDSDRFAARGTHGGSDNFEEWNLAPEEHRDWMRLSRIGSVITGSFSIDGINWSPAGRLDWGSGAPRSVLLGLAVSSRGGCRTSAITFDQIVVDGTRDLDPFPPDGGTIVWRGVPPDPLPAGLGYHLRGEGKVVFHGDDGRGLVAGPSSVQLHPAVPAGIFDRFEDIGRPCAEGSTRFDGQGYALTAGGMGSGTGQDQFHLAYSPMAGDFSLRARLAARAFPSAGAKVGLMARETCREDARYSFIHDRPAPWSTGFDARRSAGSASIEEHGLGGHPAWLRLDRVGSTFFGFTSDDGSAWALRHQEEWDPPAPAVVLAGLAFTSGEGCTPADAVLDQVTLAPVPYAVVRRAGMGTGACPVVGDGNPLSVKLQGTGPDGPDVSIQEVVRGQVEVQSITDGGTFQPFPPAPRLPVGMWADARDIGEPCFSGSTEQATGDSYIVKGGGLDIWREGDQFQFAYLEASENFQLTARIAERSWAPGTRWGKAGLMARQSLDRASRYSSVEDHGLDLQDSTRWASRPTHAGSDNYETVPLPAGLHHDWLRLSRTGDLFIGSSSPDGSSWIEQGRQRWPDAPRTVLLGLAVSSRGDCEPATIRFDQIAYQEGGGNPGHVPDGGTITWAIPRSDLTEGIGYQVTASGNGWAAFAGSADGIGIGGISSSSIARAVGLGGELSLSQDIGDPCWSGGAVRGPAPGAYQVTGSGSDIWQDGDQFQFAYREVSGDFFIAEARIAKREWAPGSRWGKAGIMAREDCTPRARYAMIQDHGADQVDQGRFAGRPTRGGADNFESTALPPRAHRDWLRLTRSGRIIAGFFSLDGESWEREGSIDLGPYPPPRMLLGLAVTSHSGCGPATVAFEGLRIQVGRNHSPTACIESDPSPAMVTLQNGQASIALRGTCSADGDGGAQGLSYLWSLAGGSGAAVFDDRELAITRVVFTRTGTYRIRLEVSDGQIEDPSASSTLEVTVSAEPLPLFRRGDADGNGAIEITDDVFFLSSLFLGGPLPLCFDAADVDDSNVLDISDAIFSLAWQYLGGRIPPLPGPWDCGLDPTPDPFPKCIYSCR